MGWKWSDKFTVDWNLKQVAAEDQVTGIDDAYLYLYTGSTLVPGLTQQQPSSSGNPALQQQITQDLFTLKSSQIAAQHYWFFYPF